MRQDANGQILDVVGDHIITPGDQGTRLSRPVERQCTPSANTHLQIIAPARPIYDVLKVIDKRIVKANFAN